VQIDLREFRGAYLAEVDEHLAAVNARLVEVEVAIRAGRGAPRELRELMRLLHTIKGLSAMVAVEPIVTVSHRMETVLRAADRAGGRVEERAFEALLAGSRAIESRLRALAAGEPVADPSPGLLAELDALDLTAEAPARPFVLEGELAGKLSASEKEQLAQGTRDGLRAVRIDFMPSAERAEKGFTITSVRERVATIAEIVKVLPLTAQPSDTAPSGLVFALVLLTNATDEALAEAAAGRPEDVQTLAEPSAGPEDRSGAAAVTLPYDVDDADVPTAQRAGVLRVDVARIDDAIEKLSALIVTRSRFAHAIARLTESGVATRDLQTILADNTRQLRELRSAILRVRMVPIGVVLDRLPLVVRGLGKTSGKQVELVVDGGAAELDKGVAERIFPALVHLLRNAVDHGIETPEERARAGKSPHGTVTIACAAQGNRQVEVRVSDDGRGIDAERLAPRSERSGRLDDASLLELLCRPGFSTRESADTTSGRGIGMDIVRRIVVDGLAGELTLSTTPGRGTTFVLRIPLTIAIVDAFTVRCGEERFVVPVPIVEEIVEIDAASLVTAPSRAGAEVRFFARRGETLPLVDLAASLGLPPATAMRHALVVRRGHDDPVAFGIDRVLAQQETVVRPLGDPLLAVAGVTGSTDLGDGRATLVLDLLGLSASLGTEGRAA
jgi:two-component system, chemotaxis family, sensor kinase CheA